VILPSLIVSEWSAARQLLIDKQDAGFTRQTHKSRSDLIFDDEGQTLFAATGCENAICSYLFC